MLDHYDIYRREAGRYERLIRREDPDRNIERVLDEWMPKGRNIRAADIGAGTGRLSAWLAQRAESLVLTDASSAMLEEAAAKLRAMGVSNWETRTADHRALPLADGSVDLVTAGWTICYLADHGAPDWEANLAAAMAEIRRALRPGGTAIVFETMGTGFFDEPTPPANLLPYYAELERRYEIGRAHV